MRVITAGGRSFDEICADFRWQIPARFNIAEAVCDRHLSSRDKTAVLCADPRARRKRYTFSDIEELSKRLANLFRHLGIARGDRIAIVLPQRVETALCHLAAYRLGAVALPLSVLFGQDALTYRLQDSGAKVVVVDGSRRDVIDTLRAHLPALEHVVDCDEQGKSGFWPGVEQASAQCRNAATASSDPALLIYTSGTTGPPKGALVAHRSLLGNLTGFEMSHNFFPQSDDLFWTPADWAWTGGLMDALLPAWYYGMPIVADPGGKFDPESACDLMRRHGVRNAFIPPTALKMLRQIGEIRQKHGVKLRSVMSAGEAVGPQLIDWGREALGIDINEMWGQTEFNYLVGNCASVMEIRRGSMGKPYPGHRVEPVDGGGQVMPNGEVGELSAWRDDPVMFLDYWNQPEAAREKFLGPWWQTGDLGYRDEDGYLWFVGRKDDVISSAGYRIGPGEVEDCLLKHPAVAQAAAVGSPDDLRGEAVKAFIVLAEGYEASEGLASDIQQAVRQDLAAYEYPREVEFVASLPLTTTGKVRRVELREQERRRKRDVG